MTVPLSSPVTGKSVLFLINRDEGGGVEYLARVLSSDLEGRGARCNTRFIYSPDDMTGRSKIASILRHSAALARVAPDILITFQPTASAISAIAGRIGGCRTRIVHQSNSPGKSHRIVRDLDRILGALGAYTVTIANSRATISEFAAYPKSYRSRMRLIEHGIPPPLHVSSPDGILAKYGVPTDGPLLLMAARLDVQKGQNILIAALPQLHGVRLVIAGSGPEHDSLMMLAREKGIAHRVHFLGHVGRQDLMDLYRASTLFVFPSSWETFGLAAVEAAMAGLPVIASDIPALREVLTCDGQTPAHFVKNRRASDWADAVAAALADPPLRSRAAAFANVIQERYSEKRMMQGYVALYAELLR